MLPMDRILATGPLHSEGHCDPARMLSSRTGCSNRVRVIAGWGGQHCLTRASSKAHNLQADVQLCERVVWLRGIDWSLSNEEVQQALKQWQAKVFVPVVTKPKQGPHKQLSHRGYAFIAFDSAEQAQEAMKALEALPLAPPGRPLVATAAPTRLLPPDWPASSTGLQQGGGEQHGEVQLISARTEKQRRHRHRKLEQRAQQLHSILSSIPAPEGLSTGDTQHSLINMPDSRVEGALAQCAVDKAAPQQLVDWECMPLACHVHIRSHGGGWAALRRSSGSDTQEYTRDMLDSHTPPQHDVEQVPLRVVRKRAQVESFAQALRVLLPPPNTTDRQHQTMQALSSTSQWRAHVVEFGSGSGNLVLPLAWVFRDVQFHAVDCKAQSIQCLLQRAAEAGLNNVTASVGLIEEYEGPLDVALALHACGSATDYAMLQAAGARAAYIISPCCIGKLQLPRAQTAATPVVQLNNEDRHPSHTHLTQLLTHPRSKWLTSHLPAPATEAFQMLAQAADVSHEAGHSHVQLARQAKVCVELDRSMSMEEAGYLTRMMTLLKPELHKFKSDLLIGVPQERLGSRFRWFV